jgi:hypothetical protein
MAGVDKSDKLVSNFNVFPYKTFGVLKRNLLTKFAQTLSNSSIIWQMMATNKDETMARGFTQFKERFVLDGLN